MFCSLLTWILSRPPLMRQWHSCCDSPSIGDQVIVRGELRCSILMRGWSERCPCVRLLLCMILSGSERAVVLVGILSTTFYRNDRTPYFSRPTFFRSAPTLAARRQFLPHPHASLLSGDAFDHGPLLYRFQRLC